MIEAYLTTSLGAFLLISRLFPRDLDTKGGWPQGEAMPSSWPTVSIIVPARNEEHTLPTLLASLEALDYPSIDVIVVDDQSEDQTAIKAQSFPHVRVLKGAPRPAGWTGKNWACHQGALAATGDYLLFTDADTSHRPDSLKRAIAALQDRDGDLLSCLPYHRSETLWEQMIGPFHILLLAMTAPYGKPRPRRVFAIGQYLLFRAKSYGEMGGHTAIRGELVDDLALARTLLQNGQCHHVYRGPALFDVRMYESLRAFIAGWRRNFRLGFTYSHPLSGLEATLMIMSLTGAGHLGTAAVPTLASVLCLAFMIWRQRTLGAFSPVGVILLPFSLGLFCLTASLALFDRVRHKELRWKGRDYAL